MQQIDLHSGMTISASAVARKATFNVEASDDLHKPAITVRGDNIVLDFNGATLRGSSQDTQPDQRKGLAILVVASNNVTIENLHVHGYKLAIYARDVKNLKLRNCDFSYNWKQHLKSTIEAEDESDWMSFHHNENDEWIFGDPGFGCGGIYLKNCDGFEVDHCRDTGSQSAIMLMNCDHGRVTNNDCSFLSAEGLGMYRTSNTLVAFNKFDWCVRGYSHGVYNRGQDSAGILVYEQSSHNKFFYNSVTHGGDGFFLWAGQSTMDTGKGGCNDNELRYNDFSHSPANGIEATFSRNSFLNNIMLECWHGIWGGYSYDTQIGDNVFGYNGASISIEHGQNNRITHNSFLRDNAAIEIWANDSKPDPSWGYPKSRDTASHGYEIAQNSFDGETAVFDVRRSTDIKIDRNRFVRNGKLFKNSQGVEFSGNDISAVASEDIPTPDANKIHIGSEFETPKPTMETSGAPIDIFDTDVDGYLRRWKNEWFNQARDAMSGVADSVGLSGEESPFLKPGTIRGRRYILVNEWGPYDFRSPILWPRGDAASGGKLFEILGPAGRWRVVDSKGVGLSSREGQVPGFLTATMTPGKASDVRITLEFVGDQITTPFGKVVAAGTPYRFGYSSFDVPIQWDVKFYRWDDSTDPRTHEMGFQNVLKGQPILTDQPQKLNYAGAAFKPGLPNDHYATEAYGSVDLPAGTYTVTLITDDGARVWFDGKLVIKDAWHYQGPTTYTADVRASAGPHQIRVQHFQIDGYARLSVDIKPKP